MKFLTGLIAAAFSLPTLAHAYQYVDCGQSDGWDHAIITIEDHFRSGTLFLSSGINDYEHEHSGVMKLKRVAERSGKIIFEAENSSSVFTVEFPRALRGQRSDSFELAIGARLKDSTYNVKSDFACFSRFYPGLVVGQ